MKAVLTAFPHALDQRDEPASSAPPIQPTAATNQGTDVRIYYTQEKISQNWLKLFWHNYVNFIGP